MQSTITKDHANAIGRASRRATERLIRDGEFEPYCEMDCPGGTLVIDAQLYDDASKDRFSDVIRVTATLHRARRVSLVAETWAASRGWLGRPSEDPSRREIVMILVEDAAGHSTTRVEIKRAPLGQITGVGSPETTYNNGPCTSQGRFARLLPPAELHDNEELRQAGEELLRHVMGRPQPGQLPGLGGAMTGRA